MMPKGSAYSEAPAPVKFSKADPVSVGLLVSWVLRNVLQLRVIILKLEFVEENKIMPPGYFL